MDIESLFTRDDHNEGAEMRVRDKFGKETDFYIMLAGVDSDLWRNAERNQRVLDMSAAVAGKKAEPRTAAQLLAYVTLGWRGLKSKGEEIAFSTEKAEEIYTNAPYIREQADAFFSNRANFTKPSKGGLLPSQSGCSTPTARTKGRKKAG